ncbi:D-arabinose 1-dehydrogenase, Zn-dependent alcohol dehydrogenase family [Pseudonocardia thermophila]|jgi:Zn-dependent alcohol dehydrogenases|uniref:alcohol dehydrogenase n=1 Tax=Pseudonocardia thermophila TaxID=1848 RepID=A0A1M6TPW9_PSETH|nr:alcohol dehydrogenase catalytic domain-containing protein [Pseudonocardia thermophila]SHK59032.1 D-arabinose 1-dehydrogenase, Zn-dependent alcohol dehydrogenase family [Pseudonocardia thermophila]
MRAALLDAFDGDVRIVEVPTPRPGPGEVLVDVAACGVGLTLERARTGALGGSTPRVVGHEIGGVIADLGSGVTGWAVGDRVTTSFYLLCGRCTWCAGGRETLCANWGGFVGVHVDGGLAEQVVLPAHGLVAVPGDVSLAAAAIAADAIATPYHALTARAPVRAGSTVAVIGAGGGVGVHTVGMARALGARVVGIEAEPGKAERLLELGCDLVTGPEDATDLPWPIDVCVDTVASRDTLAAAVGMLGRAGTVVVVGFQAGSAFELDPRPLVLDEVVITGSRYATRAEIAAALDLVAHGKVPPVIGARFPLAEVAQAYRAMQDNAVFGRIVVEVDPA